jgi:hypothetical protein
LGEGKDKRKDSRKEQEYFFQRRQSRYLKRNYLII